MIRQLVNQLLGRRPVRDDDTVLAPEPDGDLAYPWLNQIFEHLLAAPSIGTRPGYAWGMLQAAFLARSLNIESISAIELGVAGGNGLLALEDIAEALGSHLGVAIHVYGFDTGKGLPKPHDYRDTPNLWSAGAYPMDIDELRRRLRHGELIVGPVDETVQPFLSVNKPPIGFISFDLDLYSSTKAAMQLLHANTDQLLPRMHCYFDDILGFSYGHHNGERLAITEFNQEQSTRQISEIYGLRYYVPPRFRDHPWPAKMFMTHVLDHPRYNDWDGQVRHARLDLKEAA